MEKNNIYGKEKKYIRINKELSRKEEMDLLGPGFHSKTSIHKSKRVYTRKNKHKRHGEE